MKLNIPHINFSFSKEYKYNSSGNGIRNPKKKVSLALTIFYIVTKKVNTNK